MKLSGVPEKLITPGLLSLEAFGFGGFCVHPRHPIYTSIKIIS